MRERMKSDIINPVTKREGTQVVKTGTQDRIGGRRPSDKIEPPTRLPIIL